VLKIIHNDRYKSFAPAEEGWHEEIIGDMKKSLRRGRQFVPVKEMAGCLAFDEMTVSRGLVWSRGTGKLVGWTSTDLDSSRASLAALLPQDSEEDDIDSGLESKLATHVLQACCVTGCWRGGWMSVKQDICACIHVQI